MVMGNVDPVALTALVVGSSLPLIVAVYFTLRYRSADDWVIAGRRLPWYVAAGTQYATAVGGGVLVAHVGIGYAWGWSDLTYIGLVCIGLLVLAVIAPWLRREGFTTIPDILTRLIGREDKIVRSLGAFLAAVVPFGWIGTQITAFGKLFSTVTGLDMWMVSLIGALISLLYVIPAGLLSVAWTDFIFAFVMLATSLSIAGYALSMAGGWGGITANVPAELWGPQGLTAAGMQTIALWFVSIFLGTVTNQLYYLRMHAAKDERSARLGILGSIPPILMAGIYAVLLGLSVRAINPGFTVAQREMAAGWFLTQIPYSLLLVFMIFGPITIITTLDSSIHSVVVNITRDVYVSLLRPKASDRELLLINRVLSVALTLLVYGLAMLWPEALTWLVVTYGISAATLAAPILLGYALTKTKYRGAINSYSVVTSILAGAVVTYIMYVNKDPVYSGWGVLASTLALLIVGV
ncbi:MAG: sodium:solute symporter family protein, partial [Zestosphaera sp.]